MSGAARERISKGLLFAAGLPLLLFLLIPLATLLGYFSPGEISRQFDEPETSQALLLSVKTSLLSTLIVLLAGTPVAYLISRRRSRGVRLLSVLIDLPTILPPAVAGLTLLLAFGRMGFIGRWFDKLGIEIAFTATAVVLAQIFVSAPYYIKSAAIGMSSVSAEMEQSAALDGATFFQRFRYIVLPLSARSILTGAALCWARALGEFGATILFAGNNPGRTQTMPLAIYIGFERNMEQALTLSLILLALSFSILLAVHALINRNSLPPE